jgi:uracil phosphoribosyltransferase
MPQNGFISASRYHPNNDDYFEIIVEYQAIADFNENIYY